MKHKEEYIAENLYENLKRYFKDRIESVGISKEGAGVHWNCNLELNKRKSRIHCFEHRHYDEIKPEYLISFEESETNKAWGRTHDIEETIQSSEDWINNKEIDFLHQKYQFIDWYKRRIQEIESQLVENQPILKQTERELYSPWSSGLYDYHIKFKNRSCELNGLGKIEPISFYFKWDDVILFEVKQDDVLLLAEVMKKWLIDEIEPSILENQYDWIEIGELAKYYQRGQGVKGEFIKSWNSIERFYRELSYEWHPFKEDALKLIQEMRNACLDEELRAGQSLFFFILSRARRHGLEDNHTYLQVTFLGHNQMKINSNLDNKDKDVVYEVKYEGYIEEIVKELLKEKIE